MRPIAITLALALGSAGCTSLALERNTISQAESHTDLRYREVVENLAMIAANRASLPSFSSIYAGTIDISDVQQMTSGTSVARFAKKKPGTTTVLSAELLDTQASRSVKGVWTLNPVAAPEKLVALRCTCWWVLFGPESLCPECMLSRVAT